MTRRRVAVVGAGLAGLACARTLADAGIDVTVFDKGRSPGGRATSRHEPGGRTFDHGAQFFTARSPWLTERVAAWEAAGVVARWAPAGRTRTDETWWVGVPDMGAVARQLAQGLDVQLARRVEALTRSADGWTLSVASDSAPAAVSPTADVVVLAVPAAQCSALLDPGSPLAREVAAVVQTPCWCVMLAVRGAARTAADLFEDREGPIAWAAREASKPGRSAGGGEERWTLHASTSWSEAHLEDSREAVRDALSGLFLAQRGLGVADLVHATAHRWRYARGHARVPVASAATDARLVVCGDWLEGSRVESALASGVAAAARIVSPALR